MPEYIQAIERYLLDKPKLSKAALVELLTKRFSCIGALFGSQLTDVLPEPSREITTASALKPNYGQS
jgi:hypothetical protein